MAKHTSLRARFLGFAGGHFVLSALGVVVVAVVFGVTQGRGGVLGAVESRAGALWGLILLLFLFYVPMGAAVARLMGWARPTVREWLRAVALTGGVACLWGFGGFVLFCIKPTSLLGFCLLMSTAFLASPSFCLMFAVVVEHLFDTLAVFYPAIAAAALLPPVLFFLGTVLLPKRGEDGKNQLTTPQNVIK